MLPGPDYQKHSELLSPPIAYSTASRSSTKMRPGFNLNTSYSSLQIWRVVNPLTKKVRPLELQNNQKQNDLMRSPRFLLFWMSRVKLGVARFFVVKLGLWDLLVKKKRDSFLQNYNDVCFNLVLYDAFLTNNVQWCTGISKIILSLINYRSIHIIWLLKIDIYVWIQSSKQRSGKRFRFSIVFDSIRLCFNIKRMIL